MPKLKIINIADEQRDNVHGYNDKDGAVIHETVSANIMHSAADVVSVSRFLDNSDYGIHCVDDNDGNIAWALGLGRAVFYHAASGAGMANTTKIGIEQVSDVMVKYKSRAERTKAWAGMHKELNATAKVLAACARAHPGFELKRNFGDTRKPGICTHWEVTHFFNISGGHWDAQPVDRGGYYPLNQVMSLARRYYLLRWQF